MSYDNHIFIAKLKQFTIMKKIILSMAVVGMLIGTTSCRESTGEKAEDTMESAAQDAEDNMEEAGDEIEEAGDNMEEEIDEEMNDEDDM
jgi:maltose-binding protein MalE